MKDVRGERSRVESAGFERSDVGSLAEILGRWIKESGGVKRWLQVTHLQSVGFTHVRVRPLLQSTQAAPDDLVRYLSAIIPPSVASPAVFRLAAKASTESGMPSVAFNASDLGAVRSMHVVAILDREQPKGGTSALPTVLSDVLAFLVATTGVPPERFGGVWNVSFDNDAQRFDKRSAVEFARRLQRNFALDSHATAALLRYVELGCQYAELAGGRSDDEVFESAGFNGLVDRDFADDAMFTAFRVNGFRRFANESGAARNMVRFIRRVHVKASEEIAAIMGISGAHYRAIESTTRLQPSRASVDAVVQAFSLTAEEAFLWRNAIVDEYVLYPRFADPHCRQRVPELLGQNADDRFVPDLTRGAGSGASVFERADNDRLRKLVEDGILPDFDLEGALNPWPRLLRDMRSSRRLSRPEASRITQERSSLDFYSWRRIENGHRRPSVEHQQVLLQAFDLSWQPGMSRQLHEGGLVHPEVEVLSRPRDGGAFLADL
jgi:transcriptional regulator with XRE-family HTH domain